MKFFNRIALVLLVTAFAGITVFPKTQKAKVSFPNDIKVNGTAVSKGTYDLKFDDQTGELTVVKENKVIARASATAAKRDKRARQFLFRSSGTGDDTQLTSVTFSGADQDLVVSGSQASR